MSRKRSHTKAFAIDDSSDNGIYLLPGCYYNPQLEYTMCEDCDSDMDRLYAEESSHLDAFAGDGLYIADACGNVFYNCNVGYVICEEIVCSSDARMESDDLSDRGSECDNKRTRVNTSSDEDESINHGTEEHPGYIVEEPPDDDEEEGKKVPLK